MNNKEFVARLYEVQQHHKTVYFWGSFGQPVTLALVNSKRNQYPLWYTNTKVSTFKKLTDRGYFAFDCVGLIKGILWGWDNGGANYETHGVPDISANSMLAKLKEVSSNFSHIEIGEAVWMDGHIGVYVGEGKVIECSPSWSDGVQLTACANIKPIRGLHSRHWSDHGKLPWIIYEVEHVVASKPVAVKTYTVKPGDTLGEIAEKHKTTVAALVKKNKIKNPSLIRGGQIIKL